MAKRIVLHEYLCVHIGETTLDTPRCFDLHRRQAQGARGRYPADGGPCQFAPVYRVEEERGVAFVLWDGVVTADEWLTHVRRLVVDPQWPPALHLSDLRSAQIAPSIDEAVMREAVDLFGRHDKFAGLRAAIVAGDAFQKARIFEDMVAHHWGLVFTFNSLGPACGWLGIDHEYAEQALESLRAQLRT